MTSSSDQSSKVLNGIVVAATALQGITALFAIIDYVTERASGLIGSTNVDLIILFGSSVAAVMAMILWRFRSQRLSVQQQRMTIVVFVLGVSLLLFFGGLWIGERRGGAVTVTGVGLEDTPFLSLRTFGFNGSLEGWQSDDGCAPSTMSIEASVEEAFRGSGYLRMRSELSGFEVGEVITLEQVACLVYEDQDLLGLVEGLTAYVKIVPSEQTVDNTFYAEFQVRAQQGDTPIWAKTRYEVSPGEWTPIVWTLPTWLTVEGKDYLFPHNPNGIWIIIWSEKPFIGQLEVDEINFYRLDRP